MIRTPKPGTFEDRIATIEVPVSSLMRLSGYPGTEPFWRKDAACRFDDPSTGDRFGVLYAADELPTAFCESVIHENGLFNERTGFFEVAASEFSREIVTFRHPTAATLLMADFTGDHLKALGLNADICSGQRVGRDS